MQSISNSCGKASGSGTNRRISRSAELHRADLSGADLRGLDLTGVNLAETYLDGANLSGAKLSKADLSDADLSKARLCGAHAPRRGEPQPGEPQPGEPRRGEPQRGDPQQGEPQATRTSAGRSSAGMSVRYRSSKRDSHRLPRLRHICVECEGQQRDEQQDLVVTPLGEPEVTADDLEVAQFIYLLLSNEKLQRVIDTITSKVVLILGRFSPERKMVLDALRDELRNRNYAPVVFDFEKPKSGTTINTVTLLARMARFVIADISDAKSVLMELLAIVPTSPRLPVQPIIVAGQEEPGMFDFFEAYPWFLKVHPYESPAQLLVDLKDRVIGPLEAEVAKLRQLP